ncbi:hypothetical protein [Streptomyces sp. NRRL S-813]|uniref:hypothetical protein n=1 Tax=Streptomyces sp. NRRL S-813 TaxID=1463919 RepID=UPI001F184168|nr:hypothetical protein [Streptomyces sp. NRRL S-813]
MDAPAASTTPISRSGNCPSGAGVATGRMNASSSGVAAPARTELTTPEKSTTKPTDTVATTAVQTDRAARVPSETSTTHATASAACARIRWAGGPVNSTSRSIENAPNAAKVAATGEWKTWVHNAKRRGSTTVALAARRVAARTGSRRRNHAVS